MPPANFLAIGYKSKSFEALFSDSNVNTFPYVLSKPEKQYVMAFKEEILDTILSIIGMTRENIVNTVDTERPNMKLLVFDVPYEFGVCYDGSVPTQVQSMFNQQLVDILKKYRAVPFSVNYSNSAQNLAGNNWNYSFEGYRIFLATLSSSQRYEEYCDQSNPDVAIKLLGSLIVPSYIAPDAVIKLSDGTVAAVIKGDKIIINLLVETNVNESSNAAKLALMRKFIYMAMDAVMDTLSKDPGRFDRIAEVEKEYKFMEFLSRLVSKRSETHIKRLGEVRRSISTYMTQLAELIEEQKHLNSIVDAVNPDGEKERLLREISSLRKAPDVKDIVFDEDAIIINMKHVMFPHFEKKDTVLHCGEMTVMLPFDQKKPVAVFRSHIDHYPEKMRAALKKISCAHPNIFDNGELCYGNTAETFAHLRGLYDISALFTMVNNFVHVYNPKSPTIDPNMFPTTSTSEATEFFKSLYPEEMGTVSVSSYSEPELRFDTHDDN